MRSQRIIAKLFIQRIIAKIFTMLWKNTTRLGLVFRVFGILCVFAVLHVMVVPQVRRHFNDIVKVNEREARHSQTENVSRGIAEIGNLHQKNLPFFTTNEDIIRQGKRSDSSDITCPNASTYEVLDTVRTSEGDFVHILITARDSTGRQRSGGGDFWTATLTSTSAECSTSGRIQDHFNGTYSVYFISAWNGQSVLNTTLIHPSETVQYLRYEVWPRFRLYFDGFYKSGEAEYQSVCTVVSTSETFKNKCAYSHPTALGNHVFVCDVPNKNITCADLVDYGQEKGGQTPRVAAQIRSVKELLQGKDHLFKNMYSPLRNGPRFITMKKGLRPPELPPCADRQLQIESMSSGYWESNTWKSLTCQNSQFEDKQIIGECLRDKEIYIMGDSTMHLMYVELCRLLQVPYIFGSGDTRAPPSAIPRFVHVPEYNLTINFVFHQIRVGETRHFYNSVFEVDVLDTLGFNHCDYIIGLGFGIHFTQWSHSAFLDRLFSIKAAVIRFQRRCPKAKVFVKEPHMSLSPILNGLTKIDTISRSDFFVYEMAKLMKEHLHDTNAFFLDTWELNLGFPEHNAIHMSRIAVKQQLYMALSKICSDM